MTSSALFADALDKYYDITGKRLEDLPKVDNANDLIAAIEKQNDDFKHFREKAKTLTTTLKYAVMPLETVGNLASGAASAAFPPSTMIFGAVMYLIGAAKGVSTSLDAIEEMFSQLKEFTTRLSIYDKGDLSTEMREKLTNILVVLIEIIAISTKKVKNGFKSRIASLSRNILLGNDSSMTALLNKLNKLTASEGQIVLAETYAESKEVGKGVKDIQSTVANQSAKLQGLSINTEHIVAGVDELLASAKRRHQNAAKETEEEIQNKVKKILNPSIIATDRFDEIRREKLTGSGDWILSENALITWRNSEDDHIVWIEGKPGAGKSFLACHIIQWLNNKDATHYDGRVMQSGVVAYCFFKDNSDTARSVLQALRDLAFQLSKSDPSYSKYLSSKLERETEISSIRVAWLKLFVDYWLVDERDNYAYLVLDGLDEANDDDRLILFELLEDLEKKDKCKLNVALTGRSHVHDELRESIPTPLVIHIDAINNFDDISSYIDTSIRKIKTLRTLPKAVKQNVIATLKSKADGMFIWVNMMISDLSKLSKISSIEKALSVAPKGLNEMFIHTLQGFSARLSVEDVDDLNEIFTWTCLASRPLYLHELEHVFSLKENGEPLLHLRSKLQRQYGAFFNLRDFYTGTLPFEEQEKEVAESSDADDSDEKNTDEPQDVWNSDNSLIDVTLSHTSISDYFRTHSSELVRATDDSAGIGFDTRKGHAQLFLSCLAVLRTKLKDPEQVQRMQSDNSSAHWLEKWRFAEGLPQYKLVVPETFEGELRQPLHNYAAIHWLDHFRHIDDDAFDDRTKCVVRETLLALITQTDWMTVDQAYYHKGFDVVISVEVAEQLLRWLLPLSGTVQRHWTRNWLADLASGELQPLDVTWYWMFSIARDWLVEESTEFTTRVRACEAIVDWFHKKQALTPQHATEYQIYFAAKQFEFEENANWSANVGLVFEGLGHKMRAIEWYEYALSLDHEQTKALRGLAQLWRGFNAREAAIDMEQRVLATDTGATQDLQRALYEVERDYAVMVRRPFDSVDKSWFSSETAILKQVKDRLAKTNFYNFGYTYDGSDWSRAATYILLLSHTAREQLFTQSDNKDLYLTNFEEILRFAHQYEKAADDAHADFNLMNQIISWRASDDEFGEKTPDLLPHIALAAFHCGELSRLHSVFQNAIDEAQLDNDLAQITLLTERLAWLKFCYAAAALEQEEALQMWQSILDMEMTHSAKNSTEEIASETAVKKSEIVDMDNGITQEAALNDHDEPRSHVSHQTSSATPVSRPALPEHGDEADIEADIQLDDEVDDGADDSLLTSRLQALLTTAACHSTMAITHSHLQEHIKDKFHNLSTYLDKMGLAEEPLRFLGISLNMFLAPWLLRLKKKDEMQALLSCAFESILDDVKMEEDPADESLDEARTRLELLANILFAAGDMKNSSALFHVIRSYADGWAEDTETKRRVVRETHSRYKTAWTCTGPCLRPFNSFDGCNRCTLDMNAFCDDCIRMIQDETTPFRGLCNKQHEFHRLLALEIPLRWGQVPIDGRAIAFEDFKKQLRKQWNIEEKEEKEQTSSMQPSDD